MCKYRKFNFYLFIFSMYQSGIFKHFFALLIFTLSLFINQCYHYCATKPQIWTVSMHLHHSWFLLITYLIPENEVWKHFLSFSKYLALMAPMTKMCYVKWYIIKEGVDYNSHSLKLVFEWNRNVCWKQESCNSVSFYNIYLSFVLTRKGVLYYFSPNYSQNEKNPAPISYGNIFDWA